MKIPPPGSPFRPGTSALLLLCALCALPAAAQTPPAPGPPCPDAVAHQFDFWIGEWDVAGPGGQRAGENSIQPILGGCILQETWRGAQGGTGTSLNYYNPSTRKWHQFWVWQQGTTLQLEGGLHDGKMVLEGDAVTPTGAKVRHRITWTPNADGTVRQLWQSSGDAGANWQTSFDGLYRKKAVR